MSLEYALLDLAELGGHAGLAYEISFNNFGMRVGFLGLSQNTASYVRRISRRMADHQSKLLEGPERLADAIVDTAIRESNRYRMSPHRKNLIDNLLRETAALDASREGTGFLSVLQWCHLFCSGRLAPFRGANFVGGSQKDFSKSHWIQRLANTCYSKH